jgi:DNA invertase Pin-like site-specific DNA recombinase
MKNYVAYYRVSTAKQGQSGLGLEAQKAAVGQFVKDPAVIRKEFVEVESGKKNERPQLSAAIAYAKKHSCTLIIAKLDRLSRNAGFIFALRDSGVDFICADMPDANTLTVGIFAVLAQHERELISHRTKAALAAKKAQGFKLGKPDNLTLQARQKGADAHRIVARNNTTNRQVSSIITDKRQIGWTLQMIADHLNEMGYVTRRGKSFRTSTVDMLYKRDWK